MSSYTKILSKTKINNKVCLDEALKAVSALLPGFSYVQQGNQITIHYAPIDKFRNPNLTITLTNGFWVLRGDYHMVSTELTDIVKMIEQQYIVNVSNNFYAEQLYSTQVEPVQQEVQIYARRY